MARTRPRFIRNQIHHWAELLEARHLSAGSVWYQEAHTFVLRLADHYGLSTLQTAGIVAVLSPGVAWGINQRQAEALCKAHAEGLPVESVTLSTYRHQWFKAYDLLERPPVSREDLLKRIGGVWASKTQAFACNLLDPNGPEVTIDRWITRAAGCEDGRHPHPTLYRAISDAIRAEARRMGLTPTHLQAAIWVCVKDLADTRHSSTDLPF